MVAVVHQDNPPAWNGLRLTIASLRRHCPDLEIIASCPNAPASLSAWLSERCSAGVYTGPEFAGLGWNVKPRILLWALDRGYEEVLWIDADIVVSGDFLSRLPADKRVLVASEEFFFGQHQGSDARTAGWKMAPGRSLKSTVNTGIVRATEYHRPLLEAWAALLNHPDYREADEQQKGILHLIGDQDVLTALLGSAQYADVPLHLLRRGRDIAQCFGPSGFTPRERLASMRWGLPPLLHEMGPKHWQHHADSRHTGSILHRLRAAYEGFHTRLSPYMIVARGLAHEAEVSLDGFGPRNGAERTLLRVGQRYPQLAEFPIAIFDSIVRRMRKHLSIGRFEVVGG